MLCEHRVYLNASAPHSGIPSGNILLCPRTDLLYSSSDKIPMSWFAFAALSRS